MLLVAAPALLPYHAEPLLGFYQDWLALVLGLATALAALWPRRGGSIAVPPMALGLAGLVLVLALQVVLSRVTFVESSTTGILYVAWAGLIVIVGARLREAFELERAGTAIQAAFAAGGLLLAVTGFMQFWEVEVARVAILAPFGSDIFGAVGQRNYFTNIVACGLASLLVLAARGKLGLPAAAIAAAPLILALALSASRVTWLFVAIMLACAAARRDARLLAMLAIAAALLAAASWANAAGWLPNPAGVTTTGASRLINMLTHFEMLGHSQGDEGRTSLGAYAWYVFLAHPIIGAGWGEFAWNAFMVAPDLGRPVPAGLIDKHCHNLGLQLLAETGIAGAACVLAPLAAWFWPRSSFVAAKQADGLLGTWLITIATMQLGQAMLELPHWYAYLLGPFALVLGLGSRGGVRVTIASWARFVPPALAAVAIASAAARLADYRELERWVADAKAVEASRRSVPLDLVERMQTLHARSAYRAEIELMAAQFPIPEGASLSEQLELNARAMHAFPLQQLAVRRVLLLVRAGRDDEAGGVLRSVAAFYPAQVPSLMSAMARSR